MEKVLLHTSTKGASLIEILLAVAVFGLFVTAIIGGLIYGRESTALAGHRQRGTYLAEECQEAIRGLKSGDYAKLTNGTYGLSLVSGHWTLVASPDVTDIFTRSVIIADDATNQKKITCDVSWTQNLQRSGNISLVSFLSNWNTSVVSKRGGMLVYGDGGTTTDAIKYQTYNDDSGTWSTPAAAADVDGATTNKYLRSVRVYSSTTRNEKVMISRHYNGTQQFIYAQVWNGTTWGHVSLLSSWSAGTFLDVQNYDGTYQSNGNFMAVYGDFTTSPKFKIWDGSSWGTQTAMQAGQSYPNYVVAKARPGTNEVMVVVAGQGKRTESQYYNGTGYLTVNWTLVTHATNSTANTVRFADFDWSPENATKGALAYENNNKYMVAKIFTANGIGGGAWSAAVNSPTQTNNANSVGVVGRKGADNFMACDKDSKNPPDLICYEINSFTPTFITPNNNILTSSTGNGIQHSMDFDYTLSGILGLALYSNNSATPQMRTYNPTTKAFGTNFFTTALSGTMTTARLVPKPDNDDMMALMATGTNRLHSIMFDGTSNALYTTPAGKALLSHGTNGSAAVDYWYDFVWDRQ